MGWGHMKHLVITGIGLAASALAASPASAQALAVEFGDDAGQWANDGECDDSRFTGEGMTDTPLLDGDVGHDATDCRAAWDAGLLKVDASGVDFGGDTSQWANDDECDDPRFTGPGMTATTLLDSDIRADASDCRAAYEAGLLVLASDTAAPETALSNLDFGDDEGDWANDGECDDKRFEGPGMTNTPLLDEDIGHDATDCRLAFEAGRLSLVGNAAPAPAAPIDAIDFGDDASTWANDGECDDRTFLGEGMAGPPLMPGDVGHDATDCRTAWEAGTLVLRSPESLGIAGLAQVHDNIDFGVNGSDWANDGQCDDPRFEGPGMAVLATEELTDRNDCLVAYIAGAVTLK